MYNGWFRKITHMVCYAVFRFRKRFYGITVDKAKSLRTFLCSENISIILHGYFLDFIAFWWTFSQPSRKGIVQFGTSYIKFSIIISQILRRYYSRILYLNFYLIINGHILDFVFNNLSSNLVDYGFSRDLYSAFVLKTRNSY